MHQALIEQEVYRRTAICAAIDSVVEDITKDSPQILRRGSVQCLILKTLELPVSKENRILVNERMFAAGYRSIHIKGYGIYKAICRTEANS